MKCEKCGKRIKKDKDACPECGSEVIKATETKPEKTEQDIKKSGKKYKVIFITMISSVLIAVLVFLGSVVLPNTGNDFWTCIPEYSIETTQLEAGIECNALNLIEITDEGDREWEVIVAEDNIDTSKLGIYTVSYLFTSKKTERTLVIEYEVIEGELPQIEQLESVIEYGEIFDDAACFEVTNIKDFEYEIDDSNCDYNKLGTYPVYANLSNSRGVNETYEYEMKIVDTKLPTIDAKDKVLVVKGDETDLMSYATAKDNYDGDISGKLRVSGNVDTETAGTYKVTYQVADSSGNQKKESIDVVVMAAIGDEVDINNWTITAEKTYFRNQINDREHWDYIYWYYDAGIGKTFFVINLKAVNNSDEKDCFADELAWPDEEVVTLRFGDEQSYSLKTYELRNDITNSDDQYFVKAGSAGRGKLYFEVSDIYKEFEGDIILEIKSEHGSDAGKSIYVSLN